MNGRPWSERDLEELKRLYPSRPSTEVAKTLGHSLSSTYKKAAELGFAKSQEFLDSDESGRLHKGQTRPGSERTHFKKGQIPPNKGLRMPGWAPGRMKETQFKTGCRSGIAAKNWLPVGTITPDPDGYLRIKLRDAEHGKEPTGFGNSRIWPQYSRYIWEQHHGPIPPKHVVVFKDGDRKNCAIENLELLSRAQLLHRNSIWERLPRELAEVIQLNGALKRKLRKALNGKEQDNGLAGSSLRDARSA